MKMNERGVSPVVGTILLIAITVILAGTIGFFAMQQGTPEAAPQLSMSIEGNSGDYTLYHNGGDTINWKDITIKNSTGSNDGLDDAEFGPGDTVTFGNDATDPKFGNSTETNLGEGSTLIILHEPTDSVLLRSELD